MHSTISYTNRPTAAFDAVEDVKAWLGQEKWEKVYPQMSSIKNCGVFAMVASIAGISGYPVKAWYEHYHGQGSWKEED